MAIGCILVCTVCCVITYLKDRRFLNPVFIYSLFWGLISFLASLGLYGIYETSDEAYFIVGIGVVCFAFGGMFIDKFRLNPEKSRNELNHVVFNIAVLLCAICLIYNYKIIWRLISGGFSAQQMYLLVAQTSGGEETIISEANNLFELRLQQYIAYPLLYTLVPIAIKYFIDTKKKYYLFVALFFSIVRFAFDLKRTYLVIMIPYTLIILATKFEVGSQLKKMKRSTKRKVVLSSVLFLGLFILISSIRKGESYSLFDNLYHYYCACLPYFSRRLEMTDLTNYTFGFTSFRGLLAPIFAAFGLFGFGEPRLMTEATSFIQSLHDVILNVSPTYLFNSYGTVFLEFIKDGGIVGVILLSIIYGGTAQLYFKRMVKFGSRRDVIKYSYFLSSFILLSVLHFNGVVVCYIWPIALERLFYAKDTSGRK